MYWCNKYYKTHTASVYIAVIMVTLWNRTDLLPCGFFYLSVFFSSPNISHCRLDVYHTSTHGVALVRI